MIANVDHELLDWLVSADQWGGSFVQTVARAGLCADHENYPILRPALLVFKQKYPKYGTGDFAPQSHQTATVSPNVTPAGPRTTEET